MAETGSCFTPHRSKLLQDNFANLRKWNELLFREIDIIDRNKINLLLRNIYNYNQEKQLDNLKLVQRSQNGELSKVIKNGRS